MPAGRWTYFDGPRDERFMDMWRYRRCTGCEGNVVEESFTRRDGSITTVFTCYGEPGCGARFSVDEA